MQISSPVRAITTISAAVLAIVALFFVFPYSYGYGKTQISLAQMVYSLWHEYGDWEHGMLVFPIIGFLVWRQRQQLKEIPVRPAKTGLGLLIFTLFLYWIGYRTDIQYLGFIAAQLFVAALILWFLGWKHFKALFFPWAFMIFAWPFLFLDSIVAFPLRMVMADFSYRALNLIGLDTLRVGTAIVSAPDAAAGLAQGQRFEVDIADPCSGIRSLFALTMLSCLYGYFVLKKPWQILLLIASSFPLAVLGNLVRILILTFGVLAFGSDFAIGSIDQPSLFHTMAGFAVFAVALSGMLAVAKIIPKIPGWFKRPARPSASGQPPLRGTTRKITSLDY